MCRNESPVESEVDPKKRGIGKTVLVVDDNPIIRGMIAAAFLSDGFGTCVEAENGKDGVDAAERARPDVIILDLSMPVMNGLEAASKLRRLLPKTPIILFSLYGDGVSQTAASTAGVSAVLLKTLPLPTLIDKALELMSV